MKRKIGLIVVILIVLLGSTLVALATDDLDVRTSINVNDLVGENEQEDLADEENLADEEDLVNEEDYIFEENISDETASGDLFVIQDNISIKSSVDGNLYIMADNVDISGNVDGNVFVFGKNVSINSKITGSAFILADSIKFINGEVRDVYFLANSINISEGTTISREAKMLADSISISGIITGDLYSKSEMITLTEGALITGKLVYSGELYKSSEDQIGSLEKYEVQEEEVEETSVIAGKLEKVLYKTITALFIIGLIVLVTRNKKIEGKITVGDYIKGIFGGIIWIIVIPIIAAILMFTIIGFSFSIVLLIIYVLMFFVAIPIMSLQVSAYILNIKNKDSRVLLWLLAVIIYCVIAILREIPNLEIITFIVGTYGFNLIIKTLFSKKEKNNDNLVDVTND